MKDWLVRACSRFWGRVKQMPSDETIEFTLLPSGTIIHEPDEEHIVQLRFPDADAAIIFHEFLRSFVDGEIALSAHEPEN